MSWLAESTPPGLRGRAMSLRLTGNRVGQVLVPSAAGLLAAGTGAGGVLALTAAGLAAAGVAARRLEIRPPDPTDR
jgi:MFS family permease